ncbi:hypothetical protein [Crocosphaera sp.]|uniref:hypothetical protein n=1 Tax=Crocosphaera sp. TaxID=2729996 RepID=UPI003F24A045
MSSNRSYPRQPVGFFKEDNGNFSSMRLMSFVALIAAIFFGGLTLSYATQKTQTVEVGQEGQTTKIEQTEQVVNPETAVQTGFFITTCFVLAAFCPKALQKFAEQKLSITPTTSYFSNPVVPNFYNGQPRFDYTPTSPYDTVESDN